MANPVTQDDIQRLERKVNGFTVPLREYLDNKFDTMTEDNKSVREGIEFRCNLRHAGIDKFHEKVDERISALEISKALLAGKASIKSAIFIGFIAAAGLIISAISLIIVLTQ